MIIHIILCIIYFIYIYVFIYVIYICKYIFTCYIHIVYVCVCIKPHSKCWSQNLKSFFGFRNHYLLHAETMRQKSDGELHSISEIKRLDIKGLNP